MKDRKVKTALWALVTAGSTTAAISWSVSGAAAPAIACTLWAVSSGILLGMNLAGLAMKR